MPTDLDAVVQTLCLAFDADPVTEWNFPRAMADREALVEGYFRATTELILEHGGQVVTTPGQEAVGVWSPAGAPEPSEAALADYATRLVSVCGDGAERALTIMRAIDERQPADLPPHFHVMFVAVRPRQHKQGAGVEIMRMLGNALTEAGSGVRGEASNAYSFGLWQRMGAHQIGPDIQLPDGPSLYPMWAGPDQWHVDDRLAARG